MFPRDLRIRPYDAAATASERDGAENDVEFKWVEEVFKDAPAAFAAGWSPRAGTHLDAQWQKCGQCGRKRWEGWSTRSGEWYCVACWRKWQTKDD
mmetsp:Transcript_147666/g.256299  ORF Transcript_147666/g.256299 Transcript_147666/m.256299 type:complete len:95 (+) Transcript_147666:3-287(+)